MMLVPAGVKVHVALGFTDMRKGLDGLPIRQRLPCFAQKIPCKVQGIPCSVE